MAVEKGGRIETACPSSANANFTAPPKCKKLTFEKFTLNSICGAFRIRLSADGATAPAHGRVRGVHHLVDVDHSPARGTGDDPVALEEVAGP